MAPSGAIPHIVWLVCIEWLGGATNGSPTWARLITEQWLLLRSQNGSFTFICVWSHGAVETCSYASSSYVSVNELLMRKVLIVQQNVISSIFLIIMSGLFMVELDCFNEIFNGFCTSHYLSSTCKSPQPHLVKPAPGTYCYIPEGWGLQ